MYCKSLQTCTSQNLQKGDRPNMPSVVASQAFCNCPVGVCLNCSTIQGHLLRRGRILLQWGQDILGRPGSSKRADAPMAILSGNIDRQRPGRRQQTLAVSVQNTHRG